MYSRPPLSTDHWHLALFVFLLSVALWMSHSRKFSGISEALHQPRFPRYLNVGWEGWGDSVPPRRGPLPSPLHLSSATSRRRR
ncbi:hypothetical protein BDV98DRAFT_227416 [Pterulicium gracile]|uniref:Uncharacterized protein n=1 Tax=Pterulicium gracile TaxID=1884261 RepID=A0A5C3QU84_9AGAR|nr:hypothetical protein BDV98DRAFT_227416 [Pterula gracilis]